MLHIGQLLKKPTRIALNFLGLEIHRKTNATRHSRTSMMGALKHIRGLGFCPGTVIDVGAAYGTMPLYTIFPSSRLILVEPLEEYRPNLDRLAKEFSNLEYVMAAAVQRSGSITINVHPDLAGSSLYLENENSSVNGIPRVVPAVTLDELRVERQLEGPYLIKIDVQGAELDVLKGGVGILDDTEYVILESVLFQFFVGGPQFFDVITFMRGKGFVVYDVFDPVYRPLDGALSQVDVAFVKESGQFRERHSYATAAQREAQNRQLSFKFRE